MAFIDDQSRVCRQHRCLFPIVRGAPHGDVGHEKVVIDDDHVCLCRLATCLVQEALVVQRTFEAHAQVGLRGHLIPQLWTRRRRQIAERAVGRALGPLDNGVQLVAQTVVEERGARRTRLVESLQTQIIAPTLEKREAHALIGERLLEKGQILADQLLLQIDRVRRNDGALTIRRRPAQSGNQIAKGFADPGASLEESDPALVEEPRDLTRHRALARPILVPR